jgi:excisionase family DNA binding protein
MEPALMKVEDAAKYLSLGRSKMYELIAAGTIPVVHIGRAARVPRAALLAWIDDQTRLSSAGSSLEDASNGTP